METNGSIPNSFSPYIQTGSEEAPTGADAIFSG
jgi:hypothetical protein